MAKCRSVQLIGHLTDACFSFTCFCLYHTLLEWGPGIIDGGMDCRRPQKLIFLFHFSYLFMSSEILVLSKGSGISNRSVVLCCTLFVSYPEANQAERYGSAVRKAKATNTNRLDTTVARTPEISYSTGNE